MNIEGKYFVFLFSADYEGEFDSQALALFQVKEGKLKEILHPCELKNPICGGFGEDENSKVLDYLEKNKIKEVYSVHALTGKILEMKLEGENYDYQGLFNVSGAFQEEEEWKERFKKRGIELKLFS